MVTTTQSKTEWSTLIASQHLSGSKALKLESFNIQSPGFLLPCSARAFDRTALHRRASTTPRMPIDKQTMTDT